MDCPIGPILRGEGSWSCFQLMEAPNNVQLGCSRGGATATATTTTTRALLEASAGLISTLTDWTVSVVLPEELAIKVSLTLSLMADKSLRPTRPD